MKISFKKKSCDSEAVQQVDSQILEVNVKYPVNFAGDGTPGKKSLIKELIFYISVHL